MNLSLSQGLFQHRLELRLTGGATNSIFPEVEELLKESTELQKAARFLIDRRKDWRSVMDALYCAVRPTERKNCLAYYRGQGPQLKKYITEENRLKAAYRMLWALSQAYQMLQKNYEDAWGWTKKERRKILLCQAEYVFELQALVS